MNRFNEMMSTHFRSHQCVLEFRDEHRGRNVRVFNVGSPEVVGISDGTDAWMMSAAGVINGKHIPQLLAHPQYTTGVRPRAKTYGKDAASPGTAATDETPRIRVRLKI